MNNLTPNLFTLSLIANIQKDIDYLKKVVEILQSYHETEETENNEN